MQSEDQRVLEATVDWLRQPALGPVWLCTIASAQGSSPRPPGALLVCNGSAAQVGSLSGGCIEEDLLERLRSGALPVVGAELVAYGVTAEQNERLGLPCGGRLQVLVQRLERTRDEPWLLVALEAIAARECVQRRVSIPGGATECLPVASHAALQLSQDELRQTFGPQMRMLLVGAGQLSQSLAELALAMDYDVMVVDPRENIRSQWPGPAVQLLGGMPDDAVRAYASDRHSIVITLTHDPRIDDMALMEALTTDAWYVGALGSLKTTEKRLGRLRQLGVNEAQLAALHAPVGINIGSKTPLEIALSIMAELVQLRRSALAS